MDLTRNRAVEQVERRCRRLQDENNRLKRSLVNALACLDQIENPHEAEQNLHAQIERKGTPLIQPQSNAAISNGPV